jgi:hypothetical protein
MHRYRDALHQMLAHTAKGTLGAATWEVSRAGGIHAHWQFLPVPRDLIEKGLVDAAFRVEAENERYPPFETEDEGGAASEAGAGSVVGAEGNAADGVADGAKAQSKERSDYFRVWLWTPPSPSSTPSTSMIPSTEQQPPSQPRPSTTKVLTLPLDGSFRFDLQFGRRVLAKLLGLEERLNWKDCAQGIEEETSDARAFKGGFERFDFTVEE